MTKLNENYFLIAVNRMGGKEIKNSKIGTSLIYTYKNEHKILVKNEEKFKNCWLLLNGILKK